MGASRACIKGNVAVVSLVGFALGIPPPQCLVCVEGIPQIFGIIHSRLRGERLAYIVRGLEAAPHLCTCRCKYGTSSDYRLPWFVTQSSTGGKSKGDIVKSPITKFFSPKGAADASGKGGGSGTARSGGTTPSSSKKRKAAGKDAAGTPTTASSKLPGASAGFVAFCRANRARVRALEGCSLLHPHDGFEALSVQCGFRI